jgi:hypothetical protein
VEKARLVVLQSGGSRLLNCSISSIERSEKCCAFRKAERNSFYCFYAPVLYDRNSVPMLAAFTDKQRILEVPDLPKFCLLMKGLEVLRRIPPGHGLVINPGLAVGFDVSPEGIEKIVKDMG